MGSGKIMPWALQFQWNKLKMIGRDFNKIVFVHLQYEKIKRFTECRKLLMKKIEDNKLVGGLCE